MTTHRRYGKRHPEAKALAPPTARELKDGKVVYGYDEVVRVYRDWTAAEGKLSFSSMLTKRLKELERALPVVGRENWRRFIEPIAHTAVARIRSKVASEEIERIVVGHIFHVIRECPLEVAAAAVRGAIGNTKKYRADTLGKIIGLTFEQRRQLRIETIGACDVSKAQRERIKAAADVTRKADKRRQNGSVSREDYEGSSVAAFCRQHGIARATYYNRLSACRHPLTREPITRDEAEAYRGAAPVQRTVAPQSTERWHYRGAAPVQSPTEVAPEPLPGSTELDRSGGAISPPTEEMKTLVAPHLSNIETANLPAGGGQALSLPPTPLDTVTMRTTRERPMTEKTSGATVEAAGPDAPPTQSPTPSQAFAALKELVTVGDEATFMNLFEKIITRGVAERFEQEKADRDRRNDTFMLFVKHPAYATAHSVALRLAHADRTPEEIRTVLDIIGETPTMDETAGEMAVALFKQGHAPASVAMLLLNSSGMRGRA